ncbi:hypothetical protein KSB_57080 [Ktedonobacter robiniae]|uniref:Uncharacterized protein n=1 Tax=Ktedonobacter robiniae TaxID=2778365 RepID=A0ABQ3UX35_9CHLR|nr:hypothetical protein KSB_57080 [Ktedonobacter robiniae]
MPVARYKVLACATLPLMAFGRAKAGPYQSWHLDALAPRFIVKVPTELRADRNSLQVFPINYK